MVTKVEKMVSDILELVSISSITEDTEGVVKCQQKYRQIAEAMGYVTYLKAGGKVLVVEPKQMQKIPEIGIVVHLDTVAYNECEWHFNPLGEVANGRIYGRGVVDDKAAAVMALYAVGKLKGLAAKKWQIIVGSCEEGDWSDMDLYLKEYPCLPKFLFTIDGDGVQNGCRGYLDMDLQFKRHPEVGADKLQKLEVVNPVNNIVPANAYAVVNGKKIVQSGVAVHSSIPETGENALTKLTNLLSKNRSIVREFPNFFRLMQNIQNVSFQRSIGFPITECDDGCETTAVPVGCTMCEDVITLTLNVRLCVHTTMQLIREMVNCMCDMYNCNCYIQAIKLPAYINKNSKHIQMMLESYKEVLGKETSSYIAMGTGYNAALPNCVIFGPRFDVKHDEKDLCHAIDESRKISDLLIFMEMLIRYLEKALAEN